MKKLIGKSKGDTYYKIQNSPLAVSERDVAAVLDQSRIDPRLMEIITEFIRDFWWVMNPRELNKASKKSKHPFMIKVATTIILDYCEMTKSNRAEFIKWYIAVNAGIKDPVPQLLYYGVIPMFSTMMHDELKYAIPSALKHNIIFKDLPFNKGIPGVLKNESTPPENKVNDLDLLKIKIIRKIKKAKLEKKLSNDDLSKLTGINRVFLSKILNNKTENISVEYLASKSEKL